MLLFIGLDKSEQEQRKRESRELSQNEFDKFELVTKVKITGARVVPEPAIFVEANIDELCHRYYKISVPYEYADDLLNGRRSMSEKVSVQIKHPWSEEKISMTLLR
jgi:hypothetical protein